MVTQEDLERAFYYSNTCTQQQEKAISKDKWATDAEWELCQFTWHYLQQVMGGTEYWNAMEQLRKQKKAG